MFKAFKNFTNIKYRGKKISNKRLLYFTTVIIICFLYQSIPIFPLAQHDIVSVFTLPKAIYGRQDVLSELIFFIERCANLYKSSRLRNCAKSVSTPSTSYNTTPTTTIQYHHQPYHRGNSTSPISSGEIITDLTSEFSSETDSNPDPTTCTSSKSNTSPSYSSGGMDENDTSSISSKMIINNSKGASTTIVAVYGTGGIGKLRFFWKKRRKKNFFSCT